MAELNISWVLPTKREPVATGQALPVAEIKQVIVEIQRPGDAGFSFLANVLSDATVIKETTLIPGVYNFRLTVEDSGGRKSTSVIVKGTVAVANPGPVSGAAVTVT